MAIELVREPSNTPNIQNVDDFVGLRYAYANQNGFVKNKGLECGYTINGTTFNINSGRLVLQGVECDIDGNGYDITVDSGIPTKEYYTVYLQVNLALNTVSILSSKSSSSYPTISAGDDLTNLNIGTARMVLYNFDVTNSVISNVTKVVQEIKYAKEYKIDNAVNADNAINATNSINAINAIQNSDNTFSGFTKDVNEKLSANGKIVPTRIALYQGTASDYVVLSENIEIGDTIEVHLTNIKSSYFSSDKVLSEVIRTYKVEKYNASAFVYAFQQEDFVCVDSTNNTVYIQKYVPICNAKNTFNTVPSITNTLAKITISGTTTLSFENGTDKSPKVTAIYKIIE